MSDISQSMKVLELFELINYSADDNNENYAQHSEASVATRA